MESLTPEMDRDNIKRMAHSLTAFSRLRSLLKMSEQQLATMPKEVIIACAPHEIALVWDKLPKHLQDDFDILKYQYCTDHYGSNSDTLTNQSNMDVNDGPPPRKIFCCYCKVREVHVVSDNDMNHVPPITSSKVSSTGWQTPKCCCNLQ